MLILNGGGFGIAFPFGQRPLVPPNFAPNTAPNTAPNSEPNFAPIFAPNTAPNTQRNGDWRVFLICCKPAAYPKSKISELKKRQ